MKEAKEPKQYIDRSQWTSLPGDLRFKLRQVFSLPITESSIVVDDRVISDGVSDASLRVTFNVQKMQDYLGKKGECDGLFAEIVTNTRDGKDNPPAAPGETPQPQAEPSEEKVEKPKRARKKK